MADGVRDVDTRENYAEMMQATGCIACFLGGCWPLRLGWVAATVVLQPDFAGPG